MNKKPKKISFAIFLMLVIAVIIGVKLQFNNNDFTTLDVCTLRNNTCHFSNSEIDLLIQFKQEPIVEEELFITLSGSKNSGVKSAWIEGVNMYMGKTPVILPTPNSLISTNDSYKVEGVTFLGSCSKPTMQWKLFVEVENNKTETPKVYSVLFTTSVD